MDKSQRPFALNPIVDVGVLRTRYVATLAMALVAGFLVLETFAFGGGTRDAIAFAIGAAVTAAGLAGVAVSIGRQGPKQHVTIAGRFGLPMWGLLSAIATVIGAWQVVQTLVFAGGTTRWLSFADGCALELLALAGLVLHELSTERVVHALEVVGSAADGDAERRREPLHAAAR